MGSRTWVVLAALGLALVGVVVVAQLDREEQAPAQQAPGEPALPHPRQPLPRSPEPLARAMADNTRALHAAVERWRAQADPSRGRPPEEVTLRALYHQRIHILLSERPGLARAAFSRLPPALASEARDLVAARRALGRLTPPVPLRRFRAGPALPAGVLLRYYRAAERRFRVSRRVLAAVNLVESGFGRLRNASVAGARGPMQFIPSTWRAYGMGGDVDDPRDAIMGAANYLAASGAPRSYRRALYAYNRSNLYVDAVLRYARQIRRNWRTYYVLHSWQVFVRTPSGVRRITGPQPR